LFVGGGGGGGGTTMVFLTPDTFAIF